MQSCWALNQEKGTRFRHSRERGNPFYFLNQTIVQVFQFLVEVVNQLNLLRIALFEPEENWIPAFAGMTFNSL
jgi:hypothetical protein